jgi:CDP-diacylglycerol pyrophosphatase
MHLKSFFVQLLGCTSKADKQMYRYMIRLNNKDNEKFLSLFKQSGARSKSRFIADCILNNPVKIVQVNKSAIDFAMQLSQFFAQFRAIKTNYNQAFQTLVRNLGEEKARLMMKIVEKPTSDFILMRNQIEELTNQIRDRCLPK